MKTNLYEQLDFESLNQNKTSSDIFKNDNRIFFEYKNPEFYKIISSLESGLTRSGAAYYVDPVEKQAFCCSKKQRTLRLGKVIQRELTPKDFQKYNVFSENKYIIVVSRHLVDVARMSDHVGINSCLSFDEGSTATIIEANSGGMVAYVIHEKDYKFLLKSGIDIQNDEIFKDKDRGIEGIVPLSRLRIYRFVRFSNDHKSINMELAVPAEHVYGLNLNIYEIIHDFLRKNQIKSIEKIKSTDVFYTVGENTFDTSAELLLLKLTQKYKSECYPSLKA